MSTPLRHFLGLKNFDEKSIREILALAARYKAERKAISWRPLAGQTWALIFTKSSTRTRVSFEVAIRELGGNALFLNGNDLQLGRGEPIKDTARVLGRMVHGTIIRTFAQSDVEEFARYAQIPTVNALTDDEHPCQILADIQTIEEKIGPITGKKIAFIGDCACNVARSWVYAAEILKFQLVLAGPDGYLSPVTNSFVTQSHDVKEAARGADVLYTDVWVSMGLEAEKAKRAAAFQGYQINHALLAEAKKNALVLHCLPAYRDQEISEKILEERQQDIFDQAENRLHAQKGILHWLSELPVE
ncbi:MAG: ornithine carbamoyltransferase [Methylacidiphilales bacterium]|nr:ornithine carbamoyltransferase [Candidatus Methylacidiphilales bacterium]